MRYARVSTASARPARGTTAAEHPIVGSRPQAASYAPTHEGPVAAEVLDAYRRRAIQPPSSKVCALGARFWGDVSLRDRRPTSTSSSGRQTSTVAQQVLEEAGFVRDEPLPRVVRERQFYHTLLPLPADRCPFGSNCIGTSSRPTSGSPLSARCSQRPSKSAVTIACCGALSPECQRRSSARCMRVRHGLGRPRLLDVALIARALDRPWLAQASPALATSLWRSERDCCTSRPAVRRGHAGGPSTRSTPPPVGQPGARRRNVLAAMSTGS